MELDPHQLIEGCLIACYAAGLSQCFLYIRGEMAVAQERVADRAQRGLRSRLRRQEHPRQQLQRRHRAALGRRRVRRRRRDSADRKPRRQPRHAASEAPVLSGGHRPVRQADDRQQRRDARQPAVADARRRRGVHRDRHPDLARHAHGCGVGPREAARRVRDHQRHHDVPRSAVRRRVLRWHPRRQPAQGVRAGWRLGAVVPARSARSALRSQAGRRGRLDARLRCGHGDGRHHRHRCRGLLARAFLCTRIVRQVHPVPRGRHLARTDHEAPRRRSRHDPRPRPAVRDRSDDLPRRVPARCQRAARYRGQAVPVQDDDDLLRRPVRVHRRRFGADPVPRRVRGQDRAAQR